MSDGTETKIELRKIRRMLKETHRLAEHSSLCGAFEDGGPALVAQYNSMLDLLEKQGEVPAGFFKKLPSEAKLGEIGISSAQLAAYLEDDSPPNMGPPPKMGNSFNVQVGDAPWMKDIGEIIRESLPEWMRNKHPDARPGHAQHPGHPAPPPPPTDVTMNVSMNEIESRVAEVGAKLQAVAEKFRRGDLTEEQRSELAEQLSNLGREQAELAREHARFRAMEEAPA